MMTPHLVNLAEVLEHANALTAESKAVMIIAADQAADQLKPAMLEARRIVGELTRQIDDAISGNEPPLPLGLATPPPSNTGVTVHIRGDAKAA